MEINNNQYKLHASWDIHIKCNYRCPYCFFYGQWAKCVSWNIYPPVNQIVECWDRIYDRYGSAQIEISGGEPFIYPSFLELICGLSAKHSLGIITNLSWDPAILINKVSSRKVKLHVSFHPHFADIRILINRMSLLRKHGFCNGVVCVGYPPILMNAEFYKKEFENEGFNFNILPFRGRYKNITYPQGYTAMERMLVGMNVCSALSEKYQLNREAPKGKLCSSGYNYIKIHSDGGVFRCAKSPIIGNIFDEGFKLFDKPLPCASNVCDCEFMYLIEI